jgi:hypothetical protein
MRSFVLGAASALPMAIGMLADVEPLSDAGWVLVLLAGLAMQIAMAILPRYAV